jgi:glutathione S-transferase
MKLELYLKFNKLNYKSITDFDIRKAPRSKIPYIEHNWKLISDSEIIISYINKEFNINLDKGLNDEQLAISHFLKKTLEEDLYWSLVHTRCFIDTNWEITKKSFFSSMPKILLLFVPNLIRKKIIRDLNGQWTWIRNVEEINENSIESIRIISNFLWDKKYLMWNKISSIDLVLYSFVSNFSKMPHISEIKNYINEDKKLMKYLKNMDLEFSE